MHRSIAKPHHYIPHSYLDQIIRLVRQRGYELAGIEADPAYLALHQQSLDSSIDFSDFKHFIKLISDLTQDPYLGLYLGREVPITANRFVGYAISSSETLRDAFEVARRFLPTLYNVLDFELAATEELASIRVYPLADLSPIADFMYDMAVSYLDSIVRLFSGGSGARAVHFSRQQPKNESAYLKCFEALLTFDAPCNVVYFDNRILDVPSRSYDQCSQILAVEQCQKEMDRLFADREYAPEVAAILRRHANRHLGLDEVSLLLRVSSRTLRRRLQEEGVSFQAVSRDVKYEFARELLGRNSFTIASVAGQMGYSDVASFSKAFKEWSGESPRAYKRRQSASRT